MTTSELERAFYKACRQMESARVAEPRDESAFNAACREASKAQQELANKGIYV